MTSVRVCVFGVGSGLVASCAVIVTVTDPAGVLVVVRIASETAAGDADVGCTVAEGEKLQLAPTGRPLQPKVTGSPNDPWPVT